MVQPRIHPTALIEESVDVGPGTAIWDGVHIRADAVIGRDCIIGEKTYIAGGVVVGDLVKINAHVYLCCGVTVADGAMIAAHVVFTNDRTPRSTDPEITRLQTSAPTEQTLTCHVGRGATVGANATIGPGITLGDHCMVGMGAVVTADVPAHAQVVGNPARLVGLVARDGTKVWSAGPEGTLPARLRVECPGDGALLVEDGCVTHVP